MNKESLMKYIQKNSSFHRFTNLEGHSIEQLRELKERIDSQKQKEKRSKMTLEPAAE